jgi:putative transposase
MSLLDSATEFTAWSMEVSMDFRTGRHCVFMMHVHLVFVTKYRRKVFTKQIIEDLHEIFSGVCQSFEAELTEFEGEGDHVHLLVNYPPKVQISKLVNSLKTASSRVIRKKGYPTVQRALWGGALWSPSYFAGSCGGAPIDIVKKYIQDQESPD